MYVDVMFEKVAVNIIDVMGHYYYYCSAGSSMFPHSLTHSLWLSFVIFIKENANSCIVVRSQCHDDQSPEDRAAHSARFECCDCMLLM